METVRSHRGAYAPFSRSQDRAWERMVRKLALGDRMMGTALRALAHPAQLPDCPTGLLPLAMVPLHRHNLSSRRGRVSLHCHEASLYHYKVKLHLGKMSLHPHEMSLPIREGK
uniref:Uncharacterized protein n=1 Tax=Candidatus Kentrum sp. UNK TaxID=2126344 RepID=A0A451AZH1_9GAMM|nr:MAG: hypothetical protein BECKUNK1418G_GA0071005_12132 [Candidatus Kentron sp. UNK]VFK71445.1 MAG: hypothetical protein BECKUNK1418H_GA0071006_106614 [Candidatus Kentron sp. UNK]